MITFKQATNGRYVSVWPKDIQYIEAYIEDTSLIQMTYNVNFIVEGHVCDLTARVMSNLES